MPRIKCHYIDCIFVDEGFCSAAAVEIDPDTGCNTYSPSEEIEVEDEWEEEEEWEDEEDDDTWEEDDDF
jgi:hypothetical protein